jgi:flagellar biosynthesis chaperone FliJ
MSKKNTKDKLTYKQMVSYLDFMNAKMTEKFKDIDMVTGTLGYYLRAYIEMRKNHKKFEKYLEKRQKEAVKAQENLGLDAEPKSQKVKKM